MDGHRKLDRDWLIEQFRRVPADHAMGRSRDPSQPHHEILDKDSAARLRAKMVQRYRGWTGRELAEDLAIDAGLA